MKTVLKLLVVYLLIISPFDKLVAYVILLTLVSIIILFCYKIYCNKKFEIAHYKKVNDLKNLGSLLDLTDAYKYIEKTDIVYLIGGSPQLEMKSIIEYNLFNILRNRDGITIGTSAGAMNQTDRVIYKDDFKNYELVDYQGLGFIDLDIYPHFDIDNKEYMDEVFEVSKYTRIVGLPNESFIRIKDNDIEFVGKHYFIENGVME